MQDEFIRWPAVQCKSGISRSTAWRLEREGKFPLRRQLSSNAVGWLKSEIDAWIQSRKKVNVNTTEASR